MSRRLIVNADDLGYDPAINRGIVEAMRQGVVTSATLMVNLPHSAEGAAQAHGLAVGLHLNLARGAPVSPRFPASLLVAGVLEPALAHHWLRDAGRRYPQPSPSGFPKESRHRVPRSVRSRPRPRA